MLNKIPEIHVESFKTVDARDSGLHFKQLIEPEPGPEGCIKILIILFHSASTLNKIPKIHVKSFKTVDARASGLHFTTPF